jgi:hypothetical protein
MRGCVEGRGEEADAYLVLFLLLLMLGQSLRLYRLVQVLSIDRFLRRGLSLVFVRVK